MSGFAVIVARSIVFFTCLNDATLGCFSCVRFAAPVPENALVPDAGSLSRTQAEIQHKD